MAFEPYAGHAVNNLGLGNFTVVPRDVPDFSVGLEARDGPQTVNIFIDASGDDTSDYKYAASIVEACVSHTIYALQCTEGAAGICGSNVPVATVTENASQYSFSSSAQTTTAGIEVKATAIEHCELGGTTAATCTATAVVSASGQSSTATAVTTYTDAATLHFDVTITGGNDKLANPTGKCSASAASSVNTRAVALWGFLGAIGAVSVLAF
ncbi:hypothetical protein F4782DRAFT_486435 [Xylaria castorea]|nr:hypothetical protein F4782DRAFT_486435 [Xylaria castorea]